MTAQRKTLTDDTGSLVVREAITQLNSSRSGVSVVYSCGNAATTYLPLYYAVEDSFLYDVVFYEVAGATLANVNTDLAIVTIADGDMTGGGETVVKQVEEFNAAGVAASELCSMDLEAEIDGTAIGTTWTGALPARIAKGSLVCFKVVNNEGGARVMAATAAYTPIKDEINLSGGGVPSGNIKYLATRDR